MLFHWNSFDDSAIIPFPSALNLLNRKLKAALCQTQKLFVHRAHLGVHLLLWCILWDLMSLFNNVTMVADTLQMTVPSNSALFKGIGEISDTTQDLELLYQKCKEDMQNVQ